MIKNLLLVALRNLKRDIWYSLLNILGLTIGITFSLLLIFYIKDEFSYDRYNENAARIYRVSSYIREPDKDPMKWVSSQVPLAAALQKDYPEVEQATRFLPAGTPMFKYGDVHFYEDKIYFADSNVFKVFTYPFIEGDPATALVEPHSIVLTESEAIKYFGKSQGDIGKALANDKGEVFKVTGVIRDIPKHSHLLFNALISESTAAKNFGDSWGSFFLFTYVLLRPHTDGAAFEKKLIPMYNKYMASIFDQFHIKIHYVVQPLLSIHLHSDMDGEPEQVGSMSYIYIFGSVAFFMLLIACINYMNMATARSGRRAKEIGIRKVTGAAKSQLISQFLVESMLTAFLSLLLSILLVALCLHGFNTLSGKFISFQALLDPGTLAILVAVVVFVGLVGGSYPAFYLSGFNPIDTLKGSLSKGSSNVNLRRVLVVVQFSISMTMLICTWVVARQLQYLRSIDLGFNKDQVLCVAVNSSSDLHGKIEVFRNEVAGNPDVLSVSTASATPGHGVGLNLFSVESRDGYVDKGVNSYRIDENYFKTLGMQVKTGRNFSGLSDTLRGLIVNESMVRYFKWDDPIGKKVKYPGDTSGYYMQVVGVVKDFNQLSLYDTIAPLMLRYAADNNSIQVKLRPGNIPAAIAGLEKIWKTDFPDLPFSYTFLDQDFDSQYAADQKRGKIFTAFSVLTILITCLGLLGLIAFITQQRQKEISIRKILGASTGEIVPLLARNFVFLVGLSCLIAFPVSYYFMSHWLKVFKHNTGLTPIPFLLSALTVLFITLLTVTFHSVKAAMASPAKSLRSE